ncbi:MAG: short-chain dehydrogenase [Moraxellaceae bacterium]|jgi:NADP-dependent 3-hydroxy acid dehydrogenase YdfG|nr:short-chain dehydrogenase [Moraxellaceae bacterium]
MSSRSIFITGAAAGIGAATARRFAAEGWFVGLFDVDVAGVERLAAELGAARTIAGRLDVADAAQWQEALAAFMARAGRLDALVNNAGILASGAFDSIPLARQQAIVDVNVKGVLNGCHAAFPHLRATPGSCVVNMSSASAIYGQPSLAIYSATKFAVRGLTEALDIEWQPHGIRVMDVMPLFVQTAMVNGMDAKAIGKLGVNLGPEDVAATILDAVTNVPRVPRVHRLVGTQAKLAYKFAGLAPDWLARLINKTLATGH